MSVNAYKIIEIKRKDTPTFNLWNDDWICDRISLDGIRESGGGIITVDKDQINNMITELKNDSMSAAGKKECRAILKQMLKDCGDENYVEYSCY